MTTVILSAPYMVPSAAHYKSVLEHYGLEVIIPEVKERLSEKELMEFAGSFDGALCGDDRYSELVLQRCAPRLRVISKFGTGIDSIDREAASRLGIRVFNTPNAFTLPVSDSVMGYILAFARQQPWLDRMLKQGKWEKVMARSLSECTLGVVGVGNIGKAVLQRARGFGMKLLGNDITHIAPDFVLENGVEMTGLKDLLQRADFVSLNCDLNPTSRRLIDAEKLSWMKPNAVLINTARGPIVDESALIDALQRGTIAGAGLDVFENEPLALDSPLRKMDQIMLAPHNANASPAAWKRVTLNTIRNLLDGLGIDASDLEAVLG
ncbi:MAG: phosphoglycerate dehydrogenase [Anaerolineaceae bacterium]|nr:phosphoglycerate dehydrogenase [Anaerolineaceae bacterium]